MARTFFRIVQHAPPMLDDFKSHRALGLSLRDPAMAREWAEGVSVYDSVCYAVVRVRVARFRLDRYVVPLSLPDDADVTVARTGNDPRHYTLCGPPENLMTLIAGPAIEVDPR